MKIKNTFAVLALTTLATTTLSLAHADDNKKGEDKEKGRGRYNEVRNIASSTAPLNLSTTTILCVQTALEKRENALIAGHDAFNVSIKAALVKRLAGLKDAWAQQTLALRQDKRQATWKIFKADGQNAHNAMRLVKTNTWKTFDTDMQTCGVKGHGEYPQNISSQNSSI
jgi:hypothetical protein